MDARWKQILYSKWINPVWTRSDNLRSGILALQARLDLLLAELNQVCFNSPGLAIKAAGASPQFLTANTILYAIAGLVYSKAAVAATSLTAAAQQAISTFAIHLVVIDAAGTISTVAGVPAAANPLIPDCPAGKCVIGAIQIATDATHTFTAGTTNLDAVGITATYINSVGRAPLSKTAIGTALGTGIVAAAALGTQKRVVS